MVDLFRTNTIAHFNLLQLFRLQKLICIIQYISFHILIFLIIHITLIQMTLI